MTERPVRPSFDALWNRIVGHAGEGFETVHGVRFAYRIENDTIWLNDRSHTAVHLSPFRNAYDRMPVEGPSKLGNDVWGRSYVFALLNDRRIVPQGW
jgi:hypothetical protein